MLPYGSTGGVLCLKYGAANGKLKTSCVRARPPTDTHAAQRLPPGSTLDLINELQFPNVLHVYSGALARIHAQAIRKPNYQIPMQNKLGTN